MTTLLAVYAKKTVTWKENLGINQFGDANWAEHQIAVRWVPGLRMVRNNKGEEVVSTAKVLTEAPVKIGDVLVGPDGRNWPVIDLTELEGLSGKPEHREVLV